MEQYNGLLNYKKMDPLVKTAYETWSNQRSRCNNPRNTRYHSYGGRGISQNYSSREFIAWYLRNIKNGNWTKPTVGRIDHDKNYEFDNIKIEEYSENSRDACSRYWKKPGPKPKTYTKVELYCRCCDKSVKIFQSVKDAALFLGIHRTNISTSINRGSKIKKFEYSHFSLRRLTKSRCNIAME